MPQDNCPCSAKQVNVTPQDLPLCCPPEKDRLWDAHPRVYLPIESLGEITCPYCGTVYTL